MTCFIPMVMPASALMYLIPVIFIGGVFVVFYLFKDKIMAKSMSRYINAEDKWAKKDECIAEFYSDEAKFGMLQKAVGEGKIEAVVSVKPKKNVVGKVLKKGAEALIGTETFDMSSYYMAVVGDELHFMQSSGSKIVDHSVFDLKSLENVHFKQESKAMKITKYVLADGPADSKNFNLSFSSRGEKYDYTVYDKIEGFAKFTVEKQYVSNRKMGQNPFSRVYESDDIMLLYMYAPESFEIFKNKIEPLVVVKE